MEFTLKHKGTEGASHYGIYLQEALAVGFAKHIMVSKGIDHLQQALAIGSML